MRVNKAFTTDNNERWFDLWNENITISTDINYYHYTSLDSALKILDKISELENKKDRDFYYITLFATHLFYLNDGEELQRGLDKVISTIQKKLKEMSLNNDVKKCFEFYEKILNNKNSILAKYAEIMCNDDSQYKNRTIYYPNMFELSFCAEGNLLSQWKYYGKDSGIAIEFDLNNCLYRGNIVNGDAGKIWGEDRPVKIKYNDDEQIKIISGIFEQNIRNDYDAQGAIMNAIIEASYMKNYGFIEEKEYRLLFPLVYNAKKHNETDALKLIKYRVSEGIIKPYIKIDIRHKSDIYPIKSITVGPGQNQELIFNAMLNYIQSNFTKKLVKNPYKKLSDKQLATGIEVNGIKLYKSLIPFRG